MRRTHRPGRVPLLAAVLAAVPLVGCAVAADPELTEPIAVPAQVREFPSTAAGTVGATGELTRLLGILRANCLRSQGFDQAVRALSLRREANPDFTSGSLEVLPIEFGPATAEQARRYGMAGTELLADAGDVGAVVSNSKEFDRASERCEALLRERVVGLGDLQERSAAFSDEVRGAFIGHLGSRLRGTMLERAACVRAGGYPQFTEDAYLGAESMLDLLDSQAVERGVIGEHGSRVAQRQEVPDGDVAVVPPAAARTYMPAPAEVALALVFARCGDRVGFGEALERESSTAADVVEASHRRAGAGLRAELEEALGALMSSAGRDGLRP